MKQLRLVQRKKLQAGIVVTPTIGLAGNIVHELVTSVASFNIGRSAVEILLYLQFLEVFEEVLSDMLQSMAKEHVKNDK